MAAKVITVHLRTLHAKQQAFVDCKSKRIAIRAGRRGGKTVGVADLACERFLAGHRVLYGAPTDEQVQTFWYEIKHAFADAIEAGVLYKNETEHVLEVPGTKRRIRAKTCWNADTLRGDYADVLILDEFQLMAEDTWGVVGAPMLLDNDGSAVFVYTPPSLNSKSVTKAKDPRHAAKLFKRAKQRMDAGDPRWAAFHFTSHDNPFISQVALAEITYDMTALAIRQEIMAEDTDEVPGALWTRELLERTRHIGPLPTFVKVGVGVDPPGGATECGIAACAQGDNGHFYVFLDASLRASPDTWAGRVVDTYLSTKADRILGEKNYGGDMVSTTIRHASEKRDVSVSYMDVQATRGKAVRAEPIAALFEQGRAHLVGEMPLLEDEMCGWVPGTNPSPNRMDAMVWAMTYLSAGSGWEGFMEFIRKQQESKQPALAAA